MKYVYILLGLISCVYCDTPANCTYDDIKGVWLFSESERIFAKDDDCSSAPVKRLTKIELRFPNVAIDEFGNKGHWTVIYNQGFEVEVNYRKYFAYSYYEKNASTVISYCDRAAPGYGHDILVNNWSCFTGRKQVSIKPKAVPLKNAHSNNFHRYFRNDNELIAKINEKQNLWTAKSYKHLERFTIRDIHRMRGGHKSTFTRPQKINVPHAEIKEKYSSLPEIFDWRNVNGVNYVSPIRDQGKCGSCYAFSSVGMIENRLRVQTNNTVKIELSPQDIVSCSKYSQGCDGGFPYLIAGKFGQDYGLVLEKCSPYVGHNDVCTTRNCSKVYTAKYEYVGGFYGACNEDLMKIELVENGPFSVSFEVYNDFLNYGGGIYHHTGLTNSFNPFELTNHAVLLVGYGVDESSGEKFWIVKNSWGTVWGEQGYFRIRRGTDECAIESLAVKATPIP